MLRYRDALGRADVGMLGSPPQPPAPPLSSRPGPRCYLGAHPGPPHVGTRAPRGYRRISGRDGAGTPRPPPRARRPAPTSCATRLEMRTARRTRPLFRSPSGRSPASRPPGAMAAFNGGDRRPPPRGPAPRAVRPALPRAVRSCAERGRWSGAARPPPAPALRRGSIPSHPLPRAAPPRGGRSSGGRERQRETEARGGGVGGSRGTNRRKETRGRGDARVRRRGGEKRDGHGERGGDRMGAGWAQGQGKG